MYRDERCTDLATRNAPCPNADFLSYCDDINFFQVEERFGPVGGARQGGDLRRLRAAIRSPSSRYPPSPAPSSLSSSSSSSSRGDGGGPLSRRRRRRRRRQPLFHHDPLPAGCDGRDGGGGRAIRQSGVPALHRRPPFVEAGIQSVSGGSNGSATGNELQMKKDLFF